MKRGKRAHGIALATVVLLLTACNWMAESKPPSRACPKATGDAAGPPVFDSDDFVSGIDNRYFPLVPGTKFRLRGQNEDGIEHETVTVTRRTREVVGVTTTVVRDVVSVDGEPVEVTYDWYAQDRAGNVWYFGEDTAEYEDGKLTTREGSWEAGVDGAEPGIVMNADPQITESFRQEYYRGHAEDIFWVVAVDETESVPFGKFRNVLRTLEWSPLEPGIVEEKLYAPGVGLLRERTLSGRPEVVELIEAIAP